MDDYSQDPMQDPRLLALLKGQQGGIATSAPNYMPGGIQQAGVMQGYPEPPQQLEQYQIPKSPFDYLNQMMMSDAMSQQQTPNHQQEVSQGGGGGSSSGSSSEGSAGYGSMGKGLNKMGSEASSMGSSAVNGLKNGIKGIGSAFTHLL